MITYLLGWLGLCVIAVANGALREALFIPQMSPARAHQLSTATLLIALAIYIYFFLRKWPPANAGHAWTIGALWLVLTLIFEFGLGYYTGQTLREMLLAYDIRRSLWPLIPLFIAVAPYLVYRIP